MYIWNILSTDWVCISVSRWPYIFVYGVSDIPNTTNCISQLYDMRSISFYLIRQWLLLRLWLCWHLPDIRIYLCNEFVDLCQYIKHRTIVQYIFFPFPRYQLMLACWHPHPIDRPSFTDLRNKLETMLEATQAYIDLKVNVSEDYFLHSDSR